MISVRRYLHLSKNPCLGEGHDPLPQFLKLLKSELTTQGLSGNFTAVSPRLLTGFRQQNIKVFIYRMVNVADFMSNNVLHFTAVVKPYFVEDLK